MTATTPSKKESVFSFNSKSLKSTLLFWFLALSLVPIAFVGFLSHRQAVEMLEEKTFDMLQTVVDTKTAHLQYYFNGMIKSLVQEAREQANILMLETLMRDQDDTGDAPQDFVTSQRWRNIANILGEDLSIFQKIYGYDDILLIDKKGNILFSLAQNTYLGASVFSAAFQGAFLQKAVQKALDSGGTPVFSDLEYLNVIGDDPAGFILTEVVDNAGNQIGLMGFRIGLGQIESILGDLEQAHSTNGLRIYLIGADLALRSPLDERNNKEVLNRIIHTPQAAGWQKTHITATKHHSIQKTHAMVYEGPDGKPVLGIHQNLEIAGTNWGIIAEIEKEKAFESVSRLGNMVLLLLLVVALFVVLLTLPVTRRITNPLTLLSRAANLISEGRQVPLVQIKTKNEIGKLAHDFNTMATRLKAAKLRSEKLDRSRSARQELAEKMMGVQEPEELCLNIINFLAPYLEAQLGAFYLEDGMGNFQLAAGYAIDKSDNIPWMIKSGEGAVGQAAKERSKLVFADLPDDYFFIQSALGRTRPRSLLVYPIVHEDRTCAVMELGFLHSLKSTETDFLDYTSESMALCLQMAQSRAQTERLLEKTRIQAEELMVREEELRKNNELLVSQARDLQASEQSLKKQQAELEDKNDKLQSQQADLELVNQELEKSTARLETQAADLEARQNLIETQNRELRKIRKDLERNARELSRADKYKSEFLANMSHELRTPLNSLLILSGLLQKNESENLTQQQVEYVGTIHEAGNDLLNLINEILDLSKIEAGRMELEFKQMILHRFVREIKRRFDPVARQKGLDFQIRLASTCPDLLVTDETTVNRIIFNLLSNAFKFTDKGSVCLDIKPADPDRIQIQGRGPAEMVIAFTITDTGAGIPEKKRDLIFEAFQQADGGISRKFGGTGLGLTISRELAGLLGGEIVMESREGEGSSFTLHLPVQTDMAIPGTDVDSPAHDKDSDLAHFPNAKKAALSGNISSNHHSNYQPDTVRDDREEILPLDRSVLIVEDDSNFAQILMQMAKKRGFKCLMAQDGETGLELARRFKPSGIILDIGLPGIDGWTVMSRLKENLETRHIPIHFISGTNRQMEALSEGAVGYLLKPAGPEEIRKAFLKIEDIADRPVKNLLAVENHPSSKWEIKNLIGNGDVKVTVVTSGQTAIELLSEQRFDCIVLDLDAPEILLRQLFEHLKTLEDKSDIPVLVHSGGEPDVRRQALLDRYSESIVIKQIRSPEHLLDETALFLHRVEERLPEDKRRIIRMLHDPESVLRGKSVLLVDDDMRNLFALTQILQSNGIRVNVAKNGKQGLELLNAHPETDLVLMDIMMPEMDGYECMKKIRKQVRYADLPIIALTAKAMKEDRTRCMEAGASDYLRKPVDPQKLLSVLRVWLYR